MIKNDATLQEVGERTEISDLRVVEIKKLRCVVENYGIHGYVIFENPLRGFSRIFFRVIE